LCITGPKGFHVTLSGALVAGNSFTGIMVYGSAQVTVTDGSKILDNNSTSARAGAGIAAYQNSSVTVSGGTVIKGNLAWDTHGAGLDAADDAVVNITGGVRFIENISQGPTTRLYSGGGVHAGLRAVVHISNTSFEGNVATTGGGAVWGSDTSTIHIGPGTTFTGNEANSTGSDIKMDPGTKLTIANGAGISLRNESVYYLTSDCVEGQFLRAGFCQWCPTNTFSFDPSKECEPCPATAYCTGGDDLTPLPGYWHSNVKATQIHSCPGSSVVCMNDRTTGEVCAVGYEGNLCGSCNRTAGYFWDGPFKCGKCMERSRAIALYAVGAVCVIGLISFSVGSTLRDNTIRMVTGPDQQLPAQYASDFLKFLVRHMQYLVIVAGLQVQWPGAFERLLDAVGLLFNVANSQIVSIDCLFPNYRSSSVPDAVQRLLVYLLAPLGILILVLLVRLVWWGVMTLVHRLMLKRRLPGQRSVLYTGSRPLDGSQQHTNLAHSLSVAFVVVLFWFYPWFVRVGLSFFACYKLDDSSAEGVKYPEHLTATAAQGYWVLDMSQECWVGWHWLWALALGVPCIVVFVFGAPAAVVLLLYCNRSHFHERGFRAAFGFLYHDIKDGPLQVVWEAVSMIQMAIVVAISVFSYTLGAYFSILLLSICFAVFSATLFIAKPYKVRRLQTVGSASLAVMYVTSCIALSLFKADASVLVPDNSKVAIGVLGLMINVGFIVWCCVGIVVHTRGAAADWWQSFKKWLKDGKWLCGREGSPRQRFHEELQDVAHGKGRHPDEEQDVAQYKGNLELSSAAV
jgi:hypothetical protein